MSHYANRRTGEPVTVLRETADRVWWRRVDGLTLCEAPRATFERHFASALTAPLEATIAIGDKGTE